MWCVAELDEEYIRRMEDILGLDGKETTLLDTGSAQWPTALHPSPDGRYLGYGLRVYERNVVLLEDY